MVDAVYVMTPIEVAWGNVFGMAAVPAAPAVEPTSVRDALARVVRDALRRPPCGVLFSGGRDSSLVLAVAIDVARREGLPEPVAITNVFPDAPASDEADWQELVIRHLNVRDWERVVIRDELDLVGPIATKWLAEFGNVWPPTLHVDVPALERLRGGTVLDGDGGDEVLGYASHRIAPIAHLVRSPRPLRVRRVKRAMRALAPRPLRAAHRRRSLVAGGAMPWLRDEARTRWLDAMCDAEARQPLSFAASVRRIPLRQPQVLADRNRRILASSLDVAVVSPLLDPAAVDALARHGGWLSGGDRTDVLRALAGDLLPDRILARTSKAELSGSLWADHTSAFLRTWTGDGLDPDLVDADVLGDLWRGSTPVPRTAALLQQAWLCSRPERVARTKRAEK